MPCRLEKTDLFSTSPRQRKYTLR
uniref:Uncharacterized protein n=1 Tax=Rhizophora mucronata TaxID=61149 RepID=A0A2P2Q081_RHIMU